MARSKKLNVTVTPNENGSKRKGRKKKAQPVDTDRATVASLKQQLGDAYLKIHKLEQYIIEKLIE